MCLVETDSIIFMEFSIMIFCCHCKLLDLVLFLFLFSWFTTKHIGQKEQKLNWLFINHEIRTFAHSNVGNISILRSVLCYMRKLGKY